MVRRTRPGISRFSGARLRAIVRANARPGMTGLLRQRGLFGPLPAAVDREIARAGEDRARLQAVEAADRMAEMRRIRIADVLREMREVDVLVGEVQQMPRALPGAERAEGDAGLLLEQMQEARRGQAGFRRAGSPPSPARRRIFRSARSSAPRADRARRCGRASPKHMRSNAALSISPRHCCVSSVS